MLLRRTFELPTRKQKLGGRKVDCISNNPALNTKVNRVLLFIQPIPSQTMTAIQFCNKDFLENCKAIYIRLADMMCSLLVVIWPCIHLMEVWHNNKVDSCQEMNQKNHQTFHSSHSDKDIHQPTWCYHLHGTCQPT